MKNLLLLPFLFIFLSILWVGYTQSTHRTGVDLSFPRNGEILVAESCTKLEDGTNVCRFPIFMFGWFWPNTTYQLPVLMDIWVDKVLNQKIYLDENEFWNDEFSSTSYPAIRITQTRTVHYHIRILDANETLFLDQHFSFLLAEPKDIHESYKDPALANLIQHRQDLSTQSSHSDPTSNHLYLSQILQLFYQQIQHQSQSVSLTHTTYNHRHSDFLLDFIEIGTCDFDTILQAVYESYGNSSTPHSTALQYRGISIDAINSYLNNLPNVEGILKLHTAMYPLLKEAVTNEQNTKTDAEFVAEVLRILHPEGSSRDSATTTATVLDILHWDRIFYLPEFVINTHFPESTWMKGSSQMYRVHKFIAYELQRRGFSGAAIQQSLVPSMPITWLLDEVHRLGSKTHKKGIHVLKTDIEGLDWLVIREVMAYYTYQEQQKAPLPEVEKSRAREKPILTVQWPCIIEMEFGMTEYIIKHVIEKTKLDIVEQIDIDQVRGLQALREAGYKLFHEYGEHIPLPVLYSEEFVNNVIGFNCQCSQDDLLSGWALLQLHKDYDLPISLLDRMCEHNTSTDEIAISST